MAKQQKVVIEIPDWLGPDEREAVGREVVQFIRERTESGLDAKNKPFPGYSKRYMESMDFVAGGKSARVDLKLSGDMIAALDVLSHSRGKLVIGYDAGDPINDRVEGNRLGSYGGDPNPKKARDFLGIAKKDLNNILNEYRPGGDRAQRINEITEASNLFYPEITIGPEGE